MNTKYKKLIILLGIFIIFSINAFADDEDNFFIIGDDLYKVYINGNETNIEALDKENPNNYRLVNSYFYNEPFNLVAIKGEDGTGNSYIATIRASYKYNESYLGTDGSWICYASNGKEPPLYIDEDRNEYKWYEEGYIGFNWQNATEIDPPNNVSWNMDNWPDNNSKFIWSSNYISPDNNTPIDSPVYFRNKDFSGEASSLTIKQEWENEEDKREVVVDIFDKDGNIFKTVQLNEENGFYINYNIPHNMEISVKERYIEGFTSEYIINNKYNITIKNTKNPVYTLQLNAEFLDREGHVIDVDMPDGFNINIYNNSLDINTIITIFKEVDNWTGNIDYSFNIQDDVVLSSNNLMINNDVFELVNENLKITSDDIIGDTIYKTIKFRNIGKGVRVSFVPGDKAELSLSQDYYIVSKDMPLKDSIKSVPKLIIKDEYQDDFVGAYFDKYDENKRPIDFEDYNANTNSLVFYATYIKPNVFIASTGPYRVTIGRQLFSSDKYDASKIDKYYHDNLTEDIKVSIETISKSPAGFKMMYQLKNGKFKGTDENWWIFDSDLSAYTNVTPIKNDFQPDDWNNDDWPNDAFQWIWSDNFNNFNGETTLAVKSVFDAILKYNKNSLYATGFMADEIRMIGSRFNLKNSVFNLFGYDFIGWTTDRENLTRLFTPSDVFIMPIAEETTVYAKWRKKSTGNGSNVEEVEEIEEVPKGKLNYKDHYSYIMGYPDNTVRPNNNITRAEASAIFFRLLDDKYRDTVKTNRNEFKDVSEKAWYNKYISTLTNGHILKGYSDGTFRPNKNITRAEIAVIASRFDKLELMEYSPFNDTSGHWAEKYIASAAKKGWIKGYLNGTFSPDRPITRAEFITFVNNVLGRHVYTNDILDGTIEFKDLINTDSWFYSDIKVATNSYLYEELGNGYQKWIKLINSFTEK